MADSSNVHAAVVGLLIGDATLNALMPDGIYWDVGRQGSTRFVIVSQVIHQEFPMQGTTSYEVFTYLVKAVELATGSANIHAAAARIKSLLHDTTYSITGYDLMNSQCVEWVDYVETDPDDPDATWRHRGARFEIMVSPS